MQCLICEKYFISNTYNKKTCSSECSIIYRKNNRDKNNHQRTQKRLMDRFGNEYNNLPKCRICGERAINLTQHIVIIHKLESVNEYMLRYNLKKEDIFHSSYISKCSERLKGEKNPGYNHGGKFSPYSNKFVKLDGYTEEQKKKYLSNIVNKSNTSRFNNDSITTSKDYWIRRGYSEQEYKEKHSRRVFSKKKCIEKYGEVVGLEKWLQRQEKWQNTMKSKEFSEIDRINRSKMFTKSYSKISQELFWRIYHIIKDKYSHIYFATLGSDCSKIETNNEFSIQVVDKRVRYLDFYIKENDKCIEFDGDYWHGESIGNITRDRNRENSIKEVMPKLKILHIKEKEYKISPDGVLQQCLEFIYSE